MIAPPAKPGELNYALIDRYTAAHAAVGFVLGAARISMPLTIGAAILWEALERPLKDAHPSLFPSRTQDSFRNAAGDAVAMVLGRMAWRMLEKATPTKPS